MLPVSERPIEVPVPPNHFVLESPQQTVIGVPQVVLTRDSDTFSDLARAYGLGYDELVAANPGVDPWLPGDQTPVLLSTQFVLPAVARQGVVLNIASKRLFYFPKMPAGQPQVVMTYPIGIGRVGWETPLGDATVVAKAVDPAWYVPASVRKEHAAMGDPLPPIVPPGPDNPLGSRVLQLNLPGYLIHGTNKPYGVGMRVSHGCVRLYPENIESLYELVAVGETVQIINEPYLLGELDGEILFEAHAPLADDTISADDRLHDILVRLGESATYVLSEAIEENLSQAAAAAIVLPVRVEEYDPGEPLARAIHVRNIVEVDPDAATLSEVRQMMDEVLQEDDQT
ncbi:MAG: L,D-transpeptidase family protein [Proteobacteria bacterium]|nr:L,D-transpeptidase family protein [Pseudomonadota bacterium]